MRSGLATGGDDLGRLRRPSLTPPARAGGQQLLDFTIVLKHFTLRSSMQKNFDRISQIQRSRCCRAGIVLALLTAGYAGAQESQGCAAGQFGANGTCTLCSAGLFSIGNSTECVACLAGTFSRGGSSECTDCAAGQYDHDSSATTPCEMCPLHSYSESTGTVGDCTPCPSGQGTTAVGANASALCNETEFARLDVSYAKVLEGEGLLLDDLAAVTDEELDAMGLKKTMHRKRFLRFARQLRAPQDWQPEGQQPSHSTQPPPRSSSGTDHMDAQRKHTAANWKGAKGNADGFFDVREPSGRRRLRQTLEAESSRRREPAQVRILQLIRTLIRFNSV